MAVGVGLEPTSSRLTIERCTSSATLQKLWSNWRASNLARQSMLRKLVRAGGFEPPVSGFVAQYPDPLNDARIKNMNPM
jgi:hypothetical protein